ncbi:DUF7716 domain-containing protein [Paenibacillus wulumuqiensis]|uniref:DUF7716 domain-containing protein n=1 Tax=Paenibacillus wulumuqiensis TaxID=1567107 RepID=UPI000619AC7E|nr:hypothetical protein [Paenibacillus wulumuqiensis]
MSRYKDRKEDYHRRTRPDMIIFRHLAESATFKDIIEVLKQAGQPISLTMIVMALKYHYEYDAFLDYDRASCYKL